MSRRLVNIGVARSSQRYVKAALAAYAVTGRDLTIAVWNTTLC